MGHHPTVDPGDLQPPNGRLPERSTTHQRPGHQRQPQKLPDHCQNCCPNFPNCPSCHPNRSSCYPSCPASQHQIDQPIVEQLQQLQQLQPIQIWILSNEQRMSTRVTSFIFVILY